MEILDKFNYDESTDSSLPREDVFGPLSTPAEDYLHLPDSVKLEWIGSEVDVPKLAVLLSEEFIGIDAEWRSQMTQYHQTKPSLF